MENWEGAPTEVWIETIVDQSRVFTGKTILVQEQRAKKIQRENVCQHREIFCTCTYKVPNMRRNGSTPEPGPTRTKRETKENNVR
jgi:hypothetical protein